MEYRFKTAVLLTCHNRREKTLGCLTSLYHACAHGNFEVDVYLVDDGSTDGTGDSVKRQFPKVNVIQGDGNLFWNQGMRLAWNTACANQSYDFYLWLNDDVILTEFSLNDLFGTEREAFGLMGEPVIVVGAFHSGPEEHGFSYGGRDETGHPVKPNGQIQKCKMINGNAVLIPQPVFERLGNLSADYTHALGDFDYSLRAHKVGIACYTTPRYIGICPRNSGTPAWCDPQIALAKRIRLLHSPRGLNISEYYRFVLYHKGWLKAFFSKIKVYFRVLFPKLYIKLKHEER
ncbi:glycosyltransferase family 2 protein [uncultured Sunxiuqinia sp.]|uniref:glycosyltransferase family 2 protein n=1 Tax=uncultured Sunxiuqinia sp. TaxID=1573825 RepID=UPI002626A661|nr:glycosyltransferase family 2 protein [uncultured Sunxiuqinia sp.]